MERINSAQRISFFGRLAMAFRLLFSAEYATQLAAAPKGPEEPHSVSAPERVHASGLALLGALQREGRLLDFLQQEVSSFSDEEIGAAARVVHTGCRKVVLQCFSFEPAAKESEGASLTLPKGFDAHRFRLTGNVTGQPPFRGTLKHHGWIAKEIRLPALSDSIDPRIVAPAEVELA